MSIKDNKINSVIINLRLNCLFDAKHSNYSNYSICNQYTSSMRAPIRLHIDNNYNLHEKNIPIHKHENYLTTTFELIENTYIFDDNKFQKILDENTKKIFHSLKLVIIKQLNLELATSATQYNKLFSADSFEAQSKYTSEKLNLELRKLYLDELKFTNNFKKFIVNVDYEDMYSLNIEKKSITRTIPSKFNRLNYLNIFIVSLMLGVFLNLIFFILLELKKKLKEVTFKI